jgi:hypothetical protein
VEIIVQLHLERVAALECSLHKEKERNEDLDRLLGQTRETSTRLEQRR